MNYNITEILKSIKERLSCILNVFTTGLFNFYLISKASDNSSVIKAGDGKVYNITAINISATIYYLKLYDKKSAPSAADTPYIMIPIPASTDGAGYTIPYTLKGMTFINGIGMRLVSGIADNDNTSAAANDVVINIAFT